MLGLCLTLSVLLGLQVAGTGADDYVEEVCKSTMCFPIIETIDYGTYGEYYLPELKWLFTFINGTDLKSAIDTGLDKIFDYSHLNNAAETIVPISAPWTVNIELDANGVLSQEYAISISLPVEVEIPPEPKDSSVHVVHRTGYFMYGRTYLEATEDYGHVVSEFKKDLEKDGRSFYSESVYLEWFSKHGEFRIWFHKK